jgi:hypothetical protein
MYAELVKDYPLEKCELSKPFIRRIKYELALNNAPAYEPIANPKWLKVENQPYVRDPNAIVEEDDDYDAE